MISFITNGSISVIPNLVLHSSYRLSMIEPRLTLRLGASLLASKGDEINVEKEVVSGLYKKDFLKDVVYAGGDLGILLHFEKFYAGPSVGLMYIKTFDRCESCSDMWLYYTMNIGANF
ncbi:MAG: hypothetical protein ACP5QK_08780 [Myxococcota bacterium]